MKAKLMYGVPALRFTQIFSEATRARIAEMCDVIESPVPEEADKEFVLKHLGDAEILITSWGTAEVDADIAAAARNLKFVAHAAGTIKPVMSEAAWEQGIRVTGSAQAIATGVAEFCLGLMLTVPKRTQWFAERVKQGYWSKTEDIFGPAFEIFRQNVGIVGASFVGKYLIGLLKPFGCNILLYDPYCSAEQAKELGVAKVDSLEELFSQCRCVSLNAPATDETAGMIRGKHFALLQRGSVFINTARGSIINQNEMVQELRKGQFIACLDVTDPEPPTIDHELRNLPNVLLTPHEAGCVCENLLRIGEFVADEIAAYLAGEPLKGEVTHDQLATIA